VRRKFKKLKSVQKCLFHLTNRSHIPTPGNISHANFILLNQLLLFHRTPRPEQPHLSSRPLSSTSTRNSSFQTERAHGSGFSDQTKHFQILVPILKYSVSISSNMPRNLSVELRYSLYIQPTSTLKNSACYPHRTLISVVLLLEATGLSIWPL
jgi:hypothetical protein